MDKGAGSGSGWGDPKRRDPTVTRVTLGWLPIRIKPD